MVDFAHKKIIALGFFDCVHYAHRIILRSLGQLAKSCGASSAVITFFDNIKNTRAVYDYNARFEMLKNLSDEVISLNFTEELKTTSALDFLNMLKNKYNAAGFVCGYDYTFGNGGKGNAAFLKNYAEQNSLKCVVIDKCTLDGVPVSSTQIKQYIAAGEILSANKMLMLPYHMSQKVVHGRGQGHLFGFPTINFECKNDILLPKTGVYSTMSDINGVLYKSVTNVGGKPTFEDNTISVETFLQDFSSDVYDKHITVYFGDRIRDVRKFDNPESLKKQIFEDIRR